MSFQDDILAKRAKEKEDAILAKKKAEEKEEAERSERTARRNAWNAVPAGQMKITSTTTTTGYKYQGDGTSYRYTATINGETFDIKDWEYDKLKAEGCPFMEYKHYEPVQD
jgi:hypothetical protein